MWQWGGATTLSNSIEIQYPEIGVSVELTHPCTFVESCIERLLDRHHKPFAFSATPLLDVTAQGHFMYFIFPRFFFFLGWRC